MEQRAGKPVQGVFRSKILGTGSYLPPKVLSNSDLEKMVETSDAWIVERTGIRRRHIADDGVGVSDMALPAAREALEASKISAEDLEMIIFATCTADSPLPSAACHLQHKLGCRPIMAFDLEAACTGFVYGLSVADQFIRSGLYKHILVVGSEALHTFVNYKDRETCILFGDGAGAVVVGRSTDTDASEILSMHLRADGRLADLIHIPGGGSVKPLTTAGVAEGLNFVRMKGREIFRHAVRTMTEVCEEALAVNDMSVADIDWLIPHQANLRIIEAVGKHFGIAPEKVIVTIEETGNNSSATIPIAMNTALRDGRIQRGDVVLLTAFGAGLTSGSLLLRY